MSNGGQPGGTAGANAAGANAAGAGGAGEGAGGAATLNLSDAQILLVLDTLNKGEVEAAYTALPRLVDPSVEAFAEQMIVDHSSARQSVAATAEALDLNPEPSPTQRALEGEGESQVALLRSASDAAIDATYIDLQVGAHDEALALLASLEEAADAAELTQLITTLQMAVHDHYDSAVAIDADL
jgi:predicted outer membrane protein